MKFPAIVLAVSLLGSVGLAKAESIGHAPDSEAGRAIASLDEIERAQKKEAKLCLSAIRDFEKSKGSRVSPRFSSFGPSARTADAHVRIGVITVSFGSKQDQAYRLRITYSDVDGVFATKAEVIEKIAK